MSISASGIYCPYCGLQDGIGGKIPVLPRLRSGKRLPVAHCPQCGATWVQKAEKPPEDIRRADDNHTT